VEDAEVDASMIARAVAVALAVLVTAGALAGIASAGPAGPSVVPAAAHPVTGNITGPSLLAVGTNHRYLIQATGGPAVEANGTITGNLTYYASVTGGNLTGVQITPASAAIVKGAPGNPLLTVGLVPETLTIHVEIDSVLGKANESINMTYTVQVVQPYVVTAVILNPSNATTEPFSVLVYLDGVQVGNVTVPALLSHDSYNLSFSYPSAGLSSGWHTFSISLASTHGLLRFASGATTYDESFYIPGPSPDYTLWYLVGAVAFIGVLFIFGARVGARRRGTSKK
jgi:hypothetical protein